MILSITLSEEQMAELRVRNASPKSTISVSGPQDGAAVFKHLGGLTREHLAIATLDAANQVISRHTISVGTLTASLVHPREVFRPALEDNAASILVAHNHPSGNLEPSNADLAVHERLAEVGHLLGIKVMDHFIITRDDFTSLEERSP